MAIGKKADGTVQLVDCNPTYYIWYDKWTGNADKDRLAAEYMDKFVSCVIYVMKKGAHGHFCCPPLQLCPWKFSFPAPKEDLLIIENDSGSFAASHTPLFEGKPIPLRNTWTPWF